MTKDVLEKLHTLVQHSEQRVLILDNLGVEKVYICKSFHQKGLSQPYNEVVGARCIDNLLNSDTYSFNMTENELESRLSNIPFESFRFGHDNYFYLIEVKFKR